VAFDLLRQINIEVPSGMRPSPTVPRPLGPSDPPDDSAWRFENQ
jgi:hypothetical protein